MGQVITRERLRAADDGAVLRMWDDVGAIGEQLADYDMVLGRELMNLADMLFDELVDRQLSVTHYPAVEALMGVVELEECVE